MANGFFDIFADKPLYSEELYKRSQEALNRAYGTAESKVKGAGAARYRQGAADIGTTAIKGQFKGSPVEAALQRDLSAKTQQVTQGALEDLAGAKATQEANLAARADEAKIAEQKQRDTAKQQLLSGVLSGAATLAGMFIPGAAPAAELAGLTLDGVDLSEGLNLDDITSFLEA